MLFPEEDTPELRAWIVKRIENTSDADSDVLADYVIALLKHDGDLASVRKLCEEEIPDFLTEDSKAFLDDVFRTIAYKSYKSGAPPPPPLNNDANVSNGGPASSSVHPKPNEAGSKKRGFDEREDFALQNGGGTAVLGDRPIKKSRRGLGRRGARVGRGGRDFGAPFPMVPQLDPTNPMETILQMQAMGMIPQLPGQERWGRPQRRKRCRDFDTKGYCSRGSTCPYEHAFGDGDVLMGNDDQGEYDPNNASLVPDKPQWQMDGAKSSPFKTRGKNDRKQRKRGKRAPFSAAGPVHDHSKTTIVVENIPTDFLNTAKVTEFFSQFGTIESVSMQPHRSLALVKFNTWDAANAAYESPKVIFDNRFVKVFWHRDEHSSSLTANAASLQDSHMAETAGPEPVLDMEEFSRKQEEAQRLWDEKEAKRLELEQKRRELDKQQQELIDRHKEESEKLQARLAEKNGGSAVSSGADLLRAKLAELEQEAKILGIDTNAVEDASSWFPHPARGGPRGRGGGFRGRGYVPQRRGAFRGTEGRHAAYAQYSIDNRPKRLSVAGVDFSEGHREEVLRHFLLNLGEFESVDAGPDVTHVSFSDRKTAEKFYYSLNGKELPGVDGPLELQWVSSSAALPVAKGSSRDDEEEEGVGGALDGNNNEGEREDGEADEAEINMDYDTVGDGAWHQ